MDTLLDLLGDRQILLVLDNCEHLLGACAQLVKAFAGCPRTKILATSREPLGVMGEALYPVLPLALPATHISLDEIRRVESVQLFVERARSILPTFGLTAENAETVSAICRDLDGIPLAIELASARVNVLSVNQIQERLDHRLDLLVSTARADKRHRTLRAALDWSYEQLSSSEQLLLQRLTLFTAGFTLSFDWLETENDNIRAALEQGCIEAGMRTGTSLLKRSNFDVVAIMAGTEAR